MYSLDITLWTVTLCCFSVGCAEMTTWVAHCGGAPTQVNACNMKEIDCIPDPSSQAGLQKTVSLNESIRYLNITPVFTDFIDEKPGVYIRENCNESRWMPGLNITWSAGATAKENNFQVSLSYLRKRDFGALPDCHKCFRITSNNSNGTNQVITLTTKKLQCGEGYAPGHIFVRIANLDKISGILEASINLPLDLHKNMDWYVKQGLPTQYRRLIPEEYRNMSTLNPLHWTTPLYIRNSSASKEILVQFEIAPKNAFIKIYSITLTRLNSSDQVKGHFEPGSRDSIGTVLFQNVTSGMYYVQLNICGNTTCYSRGRSGITQSSDDRCSTNGASTVYPSLFSGYITILESNVYKTSSSNMQENMNSNSPLAICIGIGAAVVLILVLALILLKVRAPRDQEISRKRVLVLYCKDNDLHIEVVLKFANLLLMRCDCDVIIDEWESQRIHEVTTYTWLNRQLDKADKVIIVGSEGAHKVIKAQKEGQVWPRLEQAFLFSNIFPLAVKTIENSIRQLSERLLSVTFEYTKVPELSKSLRELRSNSHYFQMNRDFGKLLHHIHKDHTSSDSFGNKAFEVLKTDEGVQLSSSISHAQQFHQSNLNWFDARYGHPESVLCCNDGHANGNASTREQILQHGSMRQSSVYLSRNSQFDPHLSGEPLLLNS